MIPLSNELEYDELPADMKQALRVAENMFDPDSDNSEPVCIVFGANHTKCQWSLKDDMADDETKQRFCKQLSCLALNQNVDAIAVFIEARCLAVSGDLSEAEGLNIDDAAELLAKKGNDYQLHEVAILQYEDRDISYTAMSIIEKDEGLDQRHMEPWRFSQVTQENLVMAATQKHPALQGFFYRAQLLLDEMAAEAIGKEAGNGYAESQEPVSEV